MGKQRILLISLASLLIFGLLFGGMAVYQNKWIDVSILHQSQQIQGVSSAKKVQINGQKEMDVVTNHVTNLHQMSVALENLAGGLPIRYLDRSNDTLDNVFEQMQFAVQEGISRGNFLDMAANLKTQADKAGIQLELEIDSDAIYMTLNQGDHQLVEVIERHGQGKFLTSQKQ